MDKKILSLRIVMDDEMETKFYEIKKELGLSSNAEVVRFLVNRFYKELVKKGGLAAVLLSNFANLVSTDWNIVESLGVFPIFG
ncbi:predicted coding region AF_1631 [Archaeoglobus fulgidus DSM 4304]|uniref:Uncharacterized protein AF_1631 n=1 Tax=Archaeoglobus fulgidus (strain ATCC 49558 / DSM 4304 / JCM 9628 / NBRC 100126 / VC-16) TaxID=224325 RepID=Y1631_ARCFU|nr:RecName: Full=Uncharacterized protein AF_1631 [Archaeoglobus fulgidus DSM 4304]AAB89630.1 predicted coding region AF_1631 [Archaeoglobus fulgidus DSM 4304]